MKIVRFGFIAILNLFFLQMVFGQAGTWVKSGGGTFSEEAIEVVSDDSGNSYTLVNFRDTMTFMGESVVAVGEFDLGIIKLDPDGNLLWIKQFGHANNDFGRDLYYDKRGFLILAMEYWDSTQVENTIIRNYFYEFPNIPEQRNWDFVIAKLDLEGNLISYNESRGNGGEFVRKVTSDGNGMIYASCFFRGEYSTGDDLFWFEPLGYEDISIIKWKSDFDTFEWGKSFGGKLHEECHDIEIFEDSIMVFTGFFEDTLYLKADSSEFIVSNGGRDAFLIAHTQQNFLWAKAIGGTGDDYGNTIFTGSGGNILLGGTFDSEMTVDNQTLTSNGEFDGFLLSFNSGGQLTGSLSVGGPGFDGLKDVERNSTNEIILTGSFQDSAMFGAHSVVSTGPFDQDIYWCGVDDNLSVNWVKSAGGYTVDAGSSLNIGPDDVIYSTGLFQATASFGTTEHISTGGDDFFIAKALPNGSVEITSQELSADYFSLFPNPVSEYIKVEFYSDASGEMDIDLFDIRGNLVMKMVSKESISSGSTSRVYPLKEGICQGNYILRVTTNEFTHSQKVVIRR